MKALTDMTNIPAGWYPRDDEPGVRYWDGQEWEAAWLEKAPAELPEKGGTNGFSIAALVLGILWIWWIGSVLAIIFGAIALKQIPKRGQSGRGMAIAGLVLGIIGVGVFILLVIIAVASGGSSSYYYNS